jgi:tetratricopeptide (TPR) repeat protein
LKAGNQKREKHPLSLNKIVVSCRQHSSIILFMEDLKELITRVEALFTDDHYKEIISLLNEALLDKYKNADLYAWKAWAYSRLEVIDKAFDCSNKAIAADPANPFGYRQRGMAWVQKKEYDKAILDCTTSIKLKKDFARAYCTRGTAWSYKEIHDKALDDYSKAIELKNDYSDAYINRGVTWHNKGEIDKAIDDYNKAIESKNNDPLTYRNRALIWNSKKEYDQAIADFDKSIELDANDAAGFHGRGYVFYDKGDFKKAIDDFQKAIELDKNFKFLEYNIKLASEKLEERRILAASDAEQSDKDKKLKLEKSVESQIKKIRELSKSNVKTVVHYTKVFVADIYVKNIGSKMHYSNAIYMNDPMEGKVFFEYLDDKTIEEAYINGENRTETSVYLGSFLPAEENDGEISHEDELVMWRTYGKNETGKEAAGCSVVLSSDFFDFGLLSTKSPANVKESAANIREEELLNVVYIKRQKNKREITNTFKKTIEPVINDLKQELLKLIKLKNKYQKSDDFYKDIENTVFKQLSSISYLFKSADYDFEHEVRVITYMPRNSDSIKSMPVTEPNHPCKRFYIESRNDILPYIKKIYLGPKVENAQHWSLYFDYEIRQRAKELEKMTPPPYQVKPSDIEIIKSECKFQ